VVLRQHKARRRPTGSFTLLHPRARTGSRGGQRRAPHPQQVRRRLEPFAHIDVQLHPGRNLDIVTQVVSVDARSRTDIVSDLRPVYTCGCAMLETAERLAGEERAPAPALHRLTVGALRAVADGNRPRDLLLDAYLLRAHGHRRMGAGADRVRALCRTRPHRAFHIAAGAASARTAARLVRPHRRWVCWI